jgi:hypothetical protein
LRGLNRGLERPAPDGSAVGVSTCEVIVGERRRPYRHVEQHRLTPTA